MSYSEKPPKLEAQNEQMWTQPMSKETWSHGEKFVVFHHTGRQLTNTAHNPQKVKQQAE